MRLLALQQDWRYGVLELGQQICREEMCNGVMGQCKKKQRIEKAR